MTPTGKRSLTFALTLVMWLTLIGSASAAEDVRPGGTFFDDDGNVHEGSIEAIAAAAITVGCDEAGEFFCPQAEVTRAQMATFLTRAFELTPRDPAAFTDVSGVHARDIGAVEAEGWVNGCNPPANDLFCPERSISRGEVAKLLARALNLPPGPGDTFVDDDESVFEADIERLAAAGITKGCTEDRFCPGRPVTRAEMASFLARALDLRAAAPADPFDGRMVVGLPSLVFYGGLAVMEDTRIPTPIIRDSVGDPRISPDGERIAYIDVRRECPPDAASPDECYRRLFTMPFAGGIETQVTPNDARPAGHDWTPDGSEIAFLDFARSGALLMAVDPDSGAIRPLSGPFDVPPIEVSWSPDDVLVAVVSQGTGDSTIELMTPDGEVTGEIAEPDRDLSDARWSHDGSRLAYWSQGDGTSELVTTDAQGDDRRVVTSADGWDVAWSPDGTRLAYVDGDRVWCVEVAGGEPWPLTPFSLGGAIAVDWR